jgi:hypothetical protein
MSKKKTSFHRFNQQIEQEPADVSTAVVVDTPKLEVPVFKPEVRIDEDAPVIEDIKPDAASLNELFGELGTLLSQEKLTEEPVNTNPYPTGPLPSERNAPAADPTPPLSVPADTVPTPAAVDGDQDVEEEEKPQAVAEARTPDPLRQAADSLSPAVKSTANAVESTAPVDSTTPVAQSTTPPQVVVQAPARTGWVFTIHRNKQTNLIERIEADPKS